MGQGAAPTSSLHPGALSTPLGSISLPLVGSWAAPAPGSRAAATRCQTRWGTEPYTSMSAAPALHLHPALHFRKRRTLRPPPSPAPSSPGCGVEETGDLHPPWYQGTVACSPEGLAPARSPDPVGRSSVEAPSTTVWGPGPPFSQLPPFYLCFCLQIGVGSSTGPGQHSPTPVSPGEGFGSSPSAELASTFPHPTKDHTVK